MCIFHLGVLCTLLRQISKDNFECDLLYRNKNIWGHNEYDIQYSSNYYVRCHSKNTP